MQVQEENWNLSKGVAKLVSLGRRDGFLLIRTDPPTDPLPFVNGKKNVTKRVGGVWCLLRRPRTKKLAGVHFRRCARTFVQENDSGSRS
eukprot:scaffold759_cov290-Alexandrium_tamarense.AAC.2